MKRTLIICCIISMGVFSSMQAQTRYVVPKFETLYVQDYFYVELRKASECFVQFPENIKNAPSFDVKNGTLSIFASDTKAIANSALRSREPIIIGYQDLKEIELHGVVKLSCPEALQAPALYLSITGACQVELNADVSQLETFVEGASSVRLSGRATQHKLSLTGMSNIQAMGLQSETSILESAGSCKVALNSRTVSGEAGGMSIINIGPNTKSMNIENTGLARIIESTDTSRSAYNVLSFEETPIIRQPKVEYRNTDSTVSMNALGSSKGFTPQNQSNSINKSIEESEEEIEENEEEIEEIPEFQSVQSELSRTDKALQNDQLVLIRQELERSRKEMERSRREMEEFRHYYQHEREHNRHVSKKSSSGNWNRTNCFDAHWAGFEIGFNGYGLPDQLFSINLPDNYDAMRLEFSKSVQFNLNLIDFSIGFGHSGIGIATGLGFSWNVYRFMNTSSSINLMNDRFEIAPINNPTDRRYELSRLSASYFRIPILLEVQTLGSGYFKSFYLQAGIVGSVRMRSTARQLWDSLDGDGETKYRDHFYLSPFRADIEIRLGIGPIRFYASYGLNALFVKGKGPQILPYSVGLTIFNF